MSLLLLISHYTLQHFSHTDNIHHLPMMLQCLNYTYLLTTPNWRTYFTNHIIILTESHTDTLTCAHTYIHTHTYWHTVNMYILTDLHTYILTWLHTNILWKYIHINTKILRYTHIPTYSHPNILTYLHIYILKLLTNQLY